MNIHEIYRDALDKKQHLESLDTGHSTIPEKVDHTIALHSVETVIRGVERLQESIKEMHESYTDILNNVFPLKQPTTEE